MEVTKEKDDQVAKMIFGSIYPHYLNRLIKNGRTEEELKEVITWLTGYSDKKIDKLIEDKVDFKTFFKKAKLNPNAHLITGKICGYRIEDIQFPLYRQCRYMDKLVDELAKGRKMEKILRTPK